MHAISPAQKNHTLCGNCGRLRRVYAVDSYGCPVCRFCLARLPANQAAGLRERLWEGRLTAAADALCERWQRQWCRHMFEQFLQLESQRLGARAVLGRLASHHQFFQMLDENFETCLDITPALLLERCERKLLSRAAKYVSFMRDYGHAIPPKDVLEAARVQKSMSWKLRHCREHHALLAAFQAHLTDRGLRPRTVHRCVTVAGSFLSFAKGTPVSQEAIDDYLTGAPAHRSPLVTFSAYWQCYGGASTMGRKAERQGPHGAASAA